eukprot:1876629-Prymnesium_polylepis.1
MRARASSNTCRYCAHAPTRKCQPSRHTRGEGLRARTRTHTKCLPTKPTWPSAGGARTGGSVLASESARVRVRVQLRARGEGCRGQLRAR